MRFVIGRIIIEVACTRLNCNEKFPTKSQLQTHTGEHTWVPKKCTVEACVRTGTLFLPGLPGNNHTEKAFRSLTRAGFPTACLFSKVQGYPTLPAPGTVTAVALPYGLVAGFDFSTWFLRLFFFPEARQESSTPDCMYSDWARRCSLEQRGWSAAALYSLD